MNPKAGLLLSVVLVCIHIQMGEDWNDSLQSKEQIEVSLLHKYEAAMRRERALAYSFSHQVGE